MQQGMEADVSFASGEAFMWGRGYGEVVLLTCCAFMQDQMGRHLDEYCCSALFIEWTACVLCM